MSESDELKFGVPYWLMALFGGQRFRRVVDDLKPVADRHGRARRNWRFLGGIIEVGVDVESRDADESPKRMKL